MTAPPNTLPKNQVPSSRMRFGAFLAPHHPIRENPTLQFRFDLALVAQLDELGYDEFWCGEHHSTGWETIASPAMFLAAAGERTARIRLGTGCVLLPLHHPFLVAQWLVQLDHMTEGRALFGVGMSSLASDAHTFGLDPRTQRDRLDEGLLVIRKLLRGDDRFDYQSEWFTLRDAKLQLLPLQEKLPLVVTSMTGITGMTLAGKYGTGVLSKLGSMAKGGQHALSTRWEEAERSAAENGNTVDRADWRIVMFWHIAETREQAIAEAKDGLLRWHNEYIVGTMRRTGQEVFQNTEQAVEQIAFVDGATAVIGTPDDLVAKIRELVEITGGFGTVVGFAHDWASRDATRRSWDLVARYVIPELNGMLNGFRESREFERTLRLRASAGREHNDDQHGPR